MFLSYRNHSIDLQNKLVDWFLYERDIGSWRVNVLPIYTSSVNQLKID